MTVDLRKEARDRPCMVNVPNVCQGGTETTVLHHVRRNNPKIDQLGAWSCWKCHDWLHHQWVHTHTKEKRDLWELDAMFRTQRVLIQEGKL